MKVTFAILGIFAVFGVILASPPRIDPEVTAIQERGIKDSIKAAIKKAAESLAKYDPLHTDEKQISILGHTATVKNANLAGFSNFEATKVSLSIGLITTTLKLTLEAPGVTGSVENWSMEGETLYGNGAASVDIKNMKVALVAKITTFTFNLKELTVTPHIGSADVQITGILNDEVKSKEISDKINNFLNNTINNDKALHKKISKALFEMVKKLLESMFLFN